MMGNKKDNRVDYSIECQLLATALQDNTFLDDLIESCSENHFTRSNTKTLFNWIKDNYNKNESISLIKANKETNIDLESILDHGVIAADYDYLLKKLNELYIRRKIGQAGKEIFKLSQKDGLDIKEYQHKAQEIIYNNTQNENLENDGIYSLEDSLFELSEKINRIQEDDENEKKLQGIKTNYPQIDKKTGGLKKGHLIVVGARTSMGKTAFAINMSYKLLKKGNTGVFISLEMNHDEISQRLLSLDSRVPTSAYDKFGLTESQRKNMNASLNRLMDLNFTISDKRGMNTSDMRARCRKIARKKDGLDFIVIDYLQRIPIPGGGQKNTSQKIGGIVNRLRDMAGELNCPVMLISQLKRYDTSELPSISYLRNSGEIEEIADDIWLLHRQNYENEENQSDKGIKEGKVILAKGRTSGTEICEFYWYPQILYWQDKVNYKDEKINIIEGDN